MGISEICFFVAAPQAFSCRRRRRPVRLRTIFHFIAPLHMAVNCQQPAVDAAWAVSAASCSFSFFADVGDEDEDARARISISAHCACLHTNILRTCYRALPVRPSILTLCCHTYACKLYLCAALVVVFSGSLCRIPARALSCLCLISFAGAIVFDAGACIDFIFAKKLASSPFQNSNSMLFCKLSAKWQPFFPSCCCCLSSVFHVAGLLRFCACLGLRFRLLLTFDV